MESLVQTGKHGAINVEGPTIMGYYVLDYVSDAFTLQEDTTTYMQVSISGELVV